MKKNITLTFSKNGDDFDIQDIQEAAVCLINLDHWDVLNNLKFSSHFADDGNWFIQFTATIQAKKTLHIMNNLLDLYYAWSYKIQKIHKNDVYAKIFYNWTLNIEVKE